ncbi:WGR domain-containing protein [Spirosoma sp. HMF3257]|uniref:WGR domain-containing protein n=1 Tax=Spirosoma telluris TaxID=2183553 RepID=A0A327NH54_9BACT|nr:WGR domain-containing protein [Spirosoma telluris]RAI73629.1 hypothetical protein HMF3257_02875 [Spirosoma telluris]
MLHYFTFTDDTSNKFWQIETNDSRLTVTFGRIGTVGQHQQKTFETVDRCQEEASKLIREKTRKGYVELVNGVAFSAQPQSTTKATQTDNIQAQEAVLNRYDEIIRTTKTDLLLPFLQSVDKRHYVALGRKIKEARKHWCEYVELKSHEWNTENRNSAWGYRGTVAQRNIVNQSALAVLPLSDAKNFDLYWLLAGSEWGNYTLPILQWIRPKWLTDFLASTAQKERWRILDYRQLRLLEQEKLIDYQPELFALSVANLATYNHHTSQRNEAQAYIDFLTSDTIFLNRELPSLFDYPAPVNDSVYSIKDPDGMYKPISIWSQVFARLLTDGKLDRLWFFEKSLSVQTKDWNTNLRQFYRKQVEAASPSSAELLALQSNLFPLLAAQHPHVVSWTIGFLKLIYTEPDFQVGELLDWASSVMMRDDCKTALKTFLGMLEWLMKTQPDQRTAIASLLTDIFVINDLSLQTKATSLLVTYADPTDTDLQNRLSAYTGQMLGNVGTDLRKFLINEETISVHDVTDSVTYQYEPLKLVPRLVPGQEVKLPATWNDFVFLIGQFIASEDPLDMEILMNALILPPADMPIDFRLQLKVYEKRLENMRFSPMATKQCLSRYVLYWLSDDMNETKLQYDLNLIVVSNHKSDLISVTNKRLKPVHRKCKSKSTLSLLSLPTHAPYWVAPTTLVERLLAYQQADELIDPLDLAIAIARMPREDTGKAIILCDELDGEMAQLMRYCLGVSNEIILPSSKIFNQLLSVFRENNSEKDQTALWAMATRTFGPDAVYPAFADTYLSNVPNVVTPFVPTYTIKENRNEWKNYRTKELEYSPSWRELQFTLPTINKTVPIFLYSNDLRYCQGNNLRWHFDNMAAVDLGFWYSLIPQQPEALFTVIARFGVLTSDGSASVAHAINLMLQPAFRFREMSMLLVSCGLLTKKRQTGALAAEVLIHHIAEQSLDVSALGDRLGWLLAGNYAPVQRLIDVLNLVKDVSPIHNKALLQTLDALFVPFSAVGAAPKNTAKLLEIYLDLLVKLGDSPAQATIATLTNWQTIPSLKKLAIAILKKA